MKIKCKYRSAYKFAIQARFIFETPEKMPHGECVSKIEGLQQEQTSKRTLSPKSQKELRTLSEECSYAPDIKIKLRKLKDEVDGKPPIKPYEAPKEPNDINLDDALERDRLTKKFQRIFDAEYKPLEAHNLYETSALLLYKGIIQNYVNSALNKGMVENLNEKELTDAFEKDLKKLIKELKKNLGEDLENRTKTFNMSAFYADLHVPFSSIRSTNNSENPTLATHLIGQREKVVILQKLDAKYKERFEQAEEQKTEPPKPELYFIQKVYLPFLRESIVNEGIVMSPVLTHSNANTKEAEILEILNKYDTKLKEALEKIYVVKRTFGKDGIKWDKY